MHTRSNLNRRTRSTGPAHREPAVAARRTRRAAVLASAVAGGVGLLAPTAAHAIDYVWVPTLPSTYNNAANWTANGSNGIPAAGDTAQIANGGTVLIAPGDPAWTVTELRTGALAGATAGSGTYSQTGSTVTATGALRLGITDAASSGIYSVANTGSVFNFSGGAIGAAGTGLLSLTAGATANSVGGNQVNVGNLSGANGTINVSGGSVMSSAGNVSLASTATARGVVNIDGTGSTFRTTTTEFWIGNAGANTAVGTANVTNGGTLSVNNWLVVGRQQAVGMLNVSGGSTVTKSGGGNLEISEGSSGNVVNVSDTSAINVTGGELWVGQTGGGTLNLTGSAAVSVGNWIAVGRNNGVGVVNLGGNATLTKTAGSGGNITFAGTTSTLNQTGGTFNNPTSETWIGEGATSNYNLSGGTANLGGNVDFGRNNNVTGNLTMTGGTLNAATNAGSFLSFAFAGGTKTTALVSGGTINVGGTANRTGFLAVGDNGTATMNVSGSAVVSAPNLYVARTGSSVGTLNATGGTINAATLVVGNEVVGGSGISSGTLNIAGSAVINTTSLYVGKAGAGSGTVNMTGGTVNVAQFSRGTTTGAVSVNLSSGTLNNNTGADNPNFISGFRAGELNLNGVTINTGANTLGVNAAVSGSGFTKTGTGVLNITSASSTATTAVNITAGTVRLGGPTAVIPQSSVAAFYPLTSIGDDTSGGFVPRGIVRDISANGAPGQNDLTPNGGTVTATTKAPPGAGHAGSLQFSNNGFLDGAAQAIPDNTPVGNAAYTLGAWINVTGTNAAEGIVGYGTYGNGTPAGTNALRTGFYTAGNINGITNYWFGNDGSGPVPPNTTLANNWHYVAATYDPTAGSANGGYGVRTIYVDGTVIDSEDPNALHNAQGTNFTVALTQLFANPPEYFTGNIADLVIGTTAFTPDQLAVAAASDNPFAANTSGGLLSASTTANISTGATLDLNGQSQTLAGLNGTGAVTLGAGTLTVNNTTPSLFTGTIAGTGGLTKGGAGTLTLAGAPANLTYTGRTTVNAGTLTFEANTTTTRRVRNLTGGLTINGGTFAVPLSTTTAGRTVLVTNSLVLTQATGGAFAGKLDLGNGDLIVRNASAAAAATTLTTLNAAAASGFAGGRWNGNGIASAAAAADPKLLTAVGVIPNTTDGTTALYTSFDGQTTTATDVLSRYTYYGDANLDGVVNAADYTRIDAGFLLGNLTGWLNGDYNYDGKVDASDYTLMDNAFNQQTGGVATPAAALAALPNLVARPAALVAGGAGAGTAAVPEPTSLGIVAVGVVGLLGGRRRARRVDAGR